jgi:2-hydroxychromene-2-carboxylate isomerase
LKGLETGKGRPVRAAGIDGWLRNGTEPYVNPGLSETLTKLGQDPARVLAEANGEENNRLLDVETDLARSLGIFGAPTFVVEGELFWGDDRLDDAIQWHRHGTPKP